MPIAWGWTAGLVQYRDIFDNHSPLFHLATAPLLALAGERPDILFTMRAPMLVRWWRAQGHDVRVIALHNPGVAGQLEPVLPPEMVRYVPFTRAAPTLDQAAGIVF